MFMLRDEIVKFFINEGIIAKASDVRELTDEQIVLKYLNATKEWFNIATLH